MTNHKIVVPDIGAATHTEFVRRHTRIAPSPATRRLHQLSRIMAIRCNCLVWFTYESHTALYSLCLSYKHFVTLQTLLLVWLQLPVTTRLFVYSYLLALSHFCSLLFRSTSLFLLFYFRHLYYLFCFYYFSIFHSQTSSSFYLIILFYFILLLGHFILISTISHITHKFYVLHKI